MTCKHVGCGREVWAIGYCSTHANRLYTTGTTADGPRARLPLSERLWKHIEKRGPDECWPWVGKSRLSGYGYIGRGGRGTGKLLSHRAVWEVTFGPIPEGDGYHGTVVMHTCDNRLCCNPAHLRLGSQTDNIYDMIEKGRKRSNGRKAWATRRERYGPGGVPPSA